MTPFIETFTGTKFQPLEPHVGTIYIEDIAHALSQQCRFSGHTRRFYSVAEHSCRVSALLSSWGEDEDIQLWGLLHDASEAYLVDLPTPLKTHPDIGEGYRRAERTLMRAICERFELPQREPSRVAIADAVMLATEVRDLMPNVKAHWEALVVRPDEVGISPWLPRVAEEVFLKRFFSLKGRRT